MKKMNATEVNEISKESQFRIQRETEKIIEMRISAAANEGKFKAVINSNRNQQLYYTMEDGYKQELIDRGFTVTQIISPQGFEISWENVK